MTDEQKAYVCEQIAAGRPVTEIVQDENLLFSRRTLNVELNRDPHFLSQYARAREYSIETKMEEVEDILVGRGEWADLPMDRARELANHRRWEAIRLQRFRYGDKIDVDLNANIKQVEGTVIDAEALDMDQLLAIRSALQAALPAPDQEEEYEE
jgi:hypothetical protein